MKKCFIFSGPGRKPEDIFSRDEANLRYVSHIVRKSVSVIYYMYKQLMSRYRVNNLRHTCSMDVGTIWIAAIFE